LTPENLDRMVRPRLLLGAAAALVVLSTPGPFTTPAHAQPVDAVLCEELEHHGSLADLPDDAGVLQLIFRLATPTSGAEGRLLPNPGRLPIAPQTVPADVLTKPGYYVGVTTPADPPRYAYLARLADPSYVVAETSRKGEIRAEVLQRPGGVLATRVPFVANGRLIICEVTPTERTVRLAHPLGPAPFPPQGRSFKGVP
jgi:hypothetical protein